ncbi:hypothetical protein [Dyella caseinilytica]|uniref:DNA (cytosine-5-)-methyltransferase n=1 Tax=Dyella caseinilytica TaxID=1849581 RepID=A0ABX7GZ43_9GAMM|nr:hypothetical protein [Dyella caseinilytica]QRN55231.1 hypothetical protein ISN74_07850 [Dyella caseinilytica]
MKAAVYYNEIDLYCAQWLRCSKCALEKDAKSFSSNGRGGKRTICKACMAKDATNDGRVVGNANGANGKWRAGAISRPQTEVSGENRPVDGGIPHRSEYAGEGCILADTHEFCSRSHSKAVQARQPEFGSTIGWIIGHDGKARCVEPSIRLLADGIPARVGKLRAFGNAIDPRPAATFIQAYIEARGLIADQQARAA